MNEMRKLKREDMILKRRGLNFVSDTMSESIEEEAIVQIENECDNVAPKIVAILGLSNTCDISTLRKEMVKHCIEY